MAENGIELIASSEPSVDEEFHREADIIQKDL